MLAISIQTFSTNWLGWGYEGFNSSGTPYGWSQEQINGSSEWVTYGGLYTPHEGSGNIYFSSLISSVGDETMLISEPFSNNGIDNSLFTFWHMQKEFANGGGNNTLEVYYRLSETSPWVLLESYTDAYNDWTEELIMLPEQSSQMQLGFKATLVGGESNEGVALDIVKIMYLDNACSFPINLATGAVNETSAQILWEESGSATTWDIEYGDYGFNLGSGTQILGINTTPEYTLTGLTSGNQYDVYVRADCGSSQSEWAGPYTFFAQCNTVTTFPYVETFDNSNFDNDDWNVGFTVNCWSEEEGDIAEPTNFTGGDADWRPGEFGVPVDYNPDNANAALARLGFGSSWLISPSFDLGTSGDFQLEFDIALTGYNSSSDSYTLSNTDTIAVVISTDNGNTWNKSNIIKLWDATNNPSEITTTGIHSIVDLSSYTGEVKIAFYISGESGSAGYVYIDNPTIKTHATTPELQILEPKVWNAGPQLINTTAQSDAVFSIKNAGIGTLTINSITDLSGTEFSTNFNTSTTLDSGEVYTFSFEYTPVDLTNDTNYFVISTDYGTDSILLTGTAYELAPCEVEIGTDNQEVHLPANFYYNYSFSQSIFLQQEIDRDNQEFHKIYFYYNGFDQFTNERAFTIYMKHTNLNELTTWEDIATFDSLTTDTLNLTTEGWYEINLETPFAYNNTDNIAIAVYTTTVNATTVTGQSMYAHNAPNSANMSIVTYASGAIDFENLPNISPVAYRPNVRFCLESTTQVVNATDNVISNIYPNPANETISMSISSLNKISDIAIYDVYGRIVKQFKAQNTNLTIDISDLESGIYFVKAGAETHKFIKK